MSTFRAALVAAVTATAVLAPAGAALAKAETVKDSTGDVWEYVYDSNTQEGGYEFVGDVPEADLKKTTLKHTNKRIVLTGTFVGLKKKVYSGMGAELKLPKDGYGSIGVGVYGKQLYPYVHYAPARGKECKGVKGSVDRDKNRLQVSVPRKCLGGPRWVKFHASSGSYEYVSETEEHSYMDNGHNDQANWNGWSGKVKKG